VMRRLSSRKGRGREKALSLRGLRKRRGLLGAGGLGIHKRENGKRSPEEITAAGGLPPGEGDHGMKRKHRGNSPLTKLPYVKHDSL